MGAVPQAIPSAVPSAVTGSNTVPVNQRAQRLPHQPMTGKSRVPYVPGGQADAETPWQPAYATVGTTGRTLESGSPGAPSLPLDGVLFKRGPADPHYLVESGPPPVPKVNNPPTRGMLTFVKSYLNHVFQGKQHVDNAGWQQSAPQQRTSYMRFLPPPRGGGYAPETFTPRLNPQQPRTYRFNPTTGNDAPGPRPGQFLVLNTVTYGAGQTAGGIGGNQYTPPASPPATTTVTPGGSSGMPTWG